MKLGTFTIHTDLIKEQSPYLYEFFGKMIVVKAESVFHMNHIEYTAISELFDDIDEGLTAPSYEFITTKHCDDEGNVTRLDMEVVKYK